MPAQRKLSPRQMELLTEFAEKHPNVALGRFQGPQANQAARQAWKSLASRLNCVAEGTIKSPDQWRRYWIEFKARTKAKAADSRRNALSTGGGPNKLVPLNLIEERVLAIIGQVAIEGLPEVRIPINIPTEIASANTPPQPDPRNIENVELELEVETEEIIQTPPPPPSTTGPPPSTTGPPPSSTGPPPSATRPPPSTTGPPPSSTRPPPSTTRPPPLTTRPPPSTTGPPPLTTRPPPSTTGPPDHTQTPSLPQREDNHSQISCDTPHSSKQRLRRSRNIRQDPNVPQWAYELEVKRIEAEDRRTAVAEKQIEVQLKILRALIDLTATIKNKN